MKCDAAAFAGMYETIYKDLYRYALCMMRNPHDAEDVVSETVIKGYERIHTLRSEDAFKSWMFTILSNVCKHKLKGNGEARVRWRMKMCGSNYQTRRREKM